MPLQWQLQHSGASLASKVLELHLMLSGNACSSMKLKVLFLIQIQQQEPERVSSTPIQALPPASAIDLEVLDALPLHLKRELERAYGALLGNERVTVSHHSLYRHRQLCRTGFWVEHYADDRTPLSGI